MSALVLKNARVLDPDRPDQPLSHIRVEGDRIAAVGPLALEGAPARVVDLQGRTVMPGMVNGHYHASYSTISMARGLPVGMDASPALQAVRATRNIRLALDSGFTSVVSAGAPFAIDAALKTAVDEGSIPGPRIVAGSRDVSTTGHSQEAFFPWYWEGAQNPSAVLCDGADEFRRAVREEIKRGAEIIKVFATAGHGVGGPPDKVELTAEEFAAAAEAAHQRGARIRAHVANQQGISMALDAGFDVIDHGDGLDEALIDRIVQMGVFLAPSLLYSHTFTQSRTGPFADDMRRELEAMLPMLALANRAGMKLVLGDDFGGMTLSHGDYADELDYYVNQAGVPARDVLGWATRNGAELMGRGHELGAVRAGFLADLLVVDGDPLADVRILKDRSRILAVMKGGAFHKDDLAGLPHGSTPETA